MKIEQTNRFKKIYKKLYPNQLPEVNEAIQTIVNNPFTGEQKQGDLNWLWVYKFSLLKGLSLLGYTLSPLTAAASDQVTTLTLVDLGTHENFFTAI
jgi:mRNA-degrading endonuclease YafQ of YafQ-DinJ toxin-antitoxin module